VKITVLWDVTRCSLVEGYRRFGTCYFRLQDRVASKAFNAGDRFFEISLTTLY
jgi:hypothetical protein